MTPIQKALEALKLANGRLNKSGIRCTHVENAIVELEKFEPWPTREEFDSEWERVNGDHSIQFETAEWAYNYLTQRFTPPIANSSYESKQALLTAHRYFNALAKKNACDVGLCLKTAQHWNKKALDKLEAQGE